MTDTPLRLFNSLTRELETFAPLTGNVARVYTCGPTVYNYQHIGNMRAYIFADTLGRVLRFKGYDLKHVINITDVGHLTSDADAGDDKMEKAAAAQGKTAWDIAEFYQADFEADLARLNIRKPEHPRATDYVDAMIDWAKSIEDKHCYRLEGGLYFDTASVPDYGRLARANTDDGQSRIDPVPGKRQPQDFAIWRTTPPGETRQMEWDSPWGRGAPGWHIECSVMSKALLGFPFDIHTGGIDHREVHHPCEIAQNQARCPDLPLGAGTGAKIWMHNNFLIDRTKSKDSGKMSKSSGEFLRLQTLVDRRFHPLSYRLMCLQAHYRSELEFSWDSLEAAAVRLKRIVQKVRQLSGNSRVLTEVRNAVVMGNVRDLHSKLSSSLQEELQRFTDAVSDDLGTPRALTVLESVIKQRHLRQADRIRFVAIVDEVLGLNLLRLTQRRMRVSKNGGTESFSVTDKDIEAVVRTRRLLRLIKRYPEVDALKAVLVEWGVEVMDGDTGLSWDWKPVL
jgi:cysteinyl-tRNA synthetase